MIRTLLFALLLSCDSLRQGGPLAATRANVSDVLLGPLGLRGGASDEILRSPLNLRGGASDELFGGDEETVEEKLRGAMKQAAGMMRGVGSAGPEIDALERIAERDSAGVGELISAYLAARLAQSRELAGGDHYGAALRQLASEAMAFRASDRLPERDYAKFMAELAAEAGAESAEAFEADCRESSTLAARELLAVLGDNGNFVAKALARVEEKLPGIEADVEEDLARGDAGAVAHGRDVLKQFKAWQDDSSGLEALRRELLKQLEDAPDDEARGRLAESLRPVVTNVLGPDFSS